MTSLQERTPKKTTVPSIVALLSNGCKQAFPLLTVDVERARHTIIQMILSRVWCGDYMRRVLDWHLDLLDHTQLHTITVHTLLQLTTVHYNTCRVFTLYLHLLPLFQIAGSVRLQLCNSSLKTAARPEYSLVTGGLVTANCQLTLQQLLLPSVI
jgi:hypothetical protein